MHPRLPPKPIRYELHEMLQPLHTFMTRHQIDTLVFERDGHQGRATLIEHDFPKPAVEELDDEPEPVD